MIRLIGIGILVVLLLSLEQHVYQKLWKRGLHVRIDFTKNSLFEGEIGTLREVVENQKRLPLSMLKVKFQTDRHLLFEDTKGSRTTDRYYRNDVFQIGGGERITRILSYTGSKRGFYDIRSIDLVAADLFLTSQSVDTAPVNAYVYVYPRPFDSHEFRQSLKQLNGTVLTKRHLLEDPFEYRGIREYQPFDDMRSINWKATARTGDLKVNQKNYTALQAVRIFLNLEDTGILKKESCVEASIQIAAGLCRYFLNQGIQVACYGNAASKTGEQFLSIEAGAGSGQMNAVYRGLACIDTEKVVPFVEVLGQKVRKESSGTITCFVSPNQYEDFVRLIQDYQQTGSDYIWFCPVEGNREPPVLEGLADHMRFLHLDTVQTGK